jgi:hypothetical protein
MNKDAWFDYAQPLFAGFTEAPPKHNTLRATFGSTINEKYVGRRAFQNMYDIVSSWACWDPYDQEAAWETRLRFEVKPCEQHTGPIDSKCFVETDDQCVDIVCITEIISPTLRLDLKGCRDQRELSCVSLQQVSKSVEAFKLSPNATYDDVEVIKSKRFRLKTHLDWTYEFSLVWASPFVDAQDDVVAHPLFFKQEPRCQVTVSCRLIETRPVNWEYLADSFLLKVHETIPLIYRSSDGSSVSIPAADSGSD